MWRLNVELKVKKASNDLYIHFLDKEWSPSFTHYIYTAVIGLGILADGTQIETSQ